MIRPGTPEDAEGVARVHVETWQAAYAHALPREQLQALSRRGGSRKVSALAADIRRGTRRGDPRLRQRRRQPRSGDRRRAVRDLRPPQAWGTGTGRALIEAGEDELRRLGHRDAILWVLDDNPRARRFYELAGWSPDERRPRDQRLRLRRRGSPVLEGSLSRVERAQQVVRRHDCEEQRIDPVEHAAVRRRAGGHCPSPACPASAPTRRGRRAARRSRSRRRARSTGESRGSAACRARRTRRRSSPRFRRGSPPTSSPVTVPAQACAGRSTGRRRTRRCRRPRPPAGP